TAYTAQFIGQTNLLRCKVREQCAVCGPIRFPAESSPEGSATFSLRPEAIQCTADEPPATGMARFKATVRQQIYAGATEVLEVDCERQILRVRRPAGGTPLTGEQEFAFAPQSAVRVKD